jgi:hypothetical protein
MDLTEADDTALSAEYWRRRRSADQAPHEEEVRQARLEREREEAEDAAFAASIGITMDQYQSVEIRVRGKAWEESRLCGPGSRSGSSAGRPGSSAGTARTTCTPSTATPSTAW